MESTANCSLCHKFKEEGRDLAPNLTGMGAHGPAELLVHVVDASAPDPIRMAADGSGITPTVPD